MSSAQAVRETNHVRKSNKRGGVWARESGGGGGRGENQARRRAGGTTAEPVRRVGLQPASVRARSAFMPGAAKRCSAAAGLATAVLPRRVNGKQG